MIFSAGFTFFLASLLAHLPPTTSNPLGIPPTPTNMSLTASNLQCIDSPDWTTPSFLAGDCYTALDKLQNRKVLRYNSMVLEFYAANITPSYPSRFSQATPQKYKYKTCTLAIVMLKDLPGGAIPGTTLRETDLGTYVDIANAAKRIMKVCLSVVMEKGRGRGGGGGLGFVNPTGYDIAGTYSRLPLSRSSRATRRF
jgi:hypothetical protein